MSSVAASQSDSQAATSARWAVEWAYAAQDDELRRLFESVFAQPMSVQQWQWKYRNAPERGVVLRRDASAVAFFGCMPREFHWKGEHFFAAQNGDVMVLPSERAVFSRQGAFYQLVDTFCSSRIGAGTRYRFAFGFPTRRSYSLGIKLGLYAPADRIHQLRWNALPSERRLWTRTRALDRGALASIGPLWRDMLASWPGHLLPQRDAARWGYRYLDHPHAPYRLLLVSRRVGGKPLCAVALREHPDRIEWLDYVGAREQVPLAVRTLRYQGGISGKPVTGWFSSAIAPVFGEDAVAEITDVHIPVSAPRYGSMIPDESGPLWLMGGDTDFL